MASSGLQLLGFVLSLVGVVSTVAATLMVEWKKQVQGKHRIYEGMWMTCGGTERTTCEIYEYVLKLPPEIQATRAVLVISLFISTLAMIISTVGMKCTRFIDGMAESKAFIAMIGGIMFIIAGLLTIIITSWYVQRVVKTFHEAHDLYRPDFGKAVFVSWAGGVLTTAGGTFLSCRRCWGSQASKSMSSSHLIPITDSKSNYV